MGHRYGKTILVHSSELERYAYPESCPFKTQRAGLMRRMLESMRGLSGPDRGETAPEPADEADLMRLHTRRYLDALRAAEDGRLDVEGLEMGLGTEDTPVFRGLCAYATLACGATLKAAELVESGEAEATFNPSGGFHHAGPERAAGFCYINDVAIACHWLAERGRRVLYLDVDAHHADGVQEAFWTRSDVMTISVHESGKTLFPGTGFEDEIGDGEGRGYCVNAPLPEDTYDEAYLRLFEEAVEPLMKAYDPDVVVLELGMDCLASDPLAHLSLTNNAYAEVVCRVMALDKPIVAVGGGGYHPENTARSWALMWRLLCGDDDQSELALGLGGVMLQSADWLAGLRDPASSPTRAQRERVEPAVDAVIENIRARVFPAHGL